MENLNKAMIIRNGNLIGSPSVDFEELTFEQYKTMEANGEIDLNKKYLVKADDSGALLSATDVSYDEDTSVKGKINELDGKIANELKTSQNTGIVNVTLTSNGTFESMGNNYNKYQVRNGVCYFQFFVSSTAATNTFTEICTGLPKPIFPQYFAYPVYYNEQRENKTLQVHISENGTLSASNSLVTTSYMIAGSYPIA